MKKIVDAVAVILNIPYWAAKSVLTGVVLMAISGALYFIGIPEFIYVTVLIAGAALVRSLGNYMASDL